MNRGSVGLGMATRHTPISTHNDQKRGRSSVVFLSLSIFLILISIFSADITRYAKNHYMDKMVSLSELAEKPWGVIRDNIASVNALWDVRETNEMLAAENKRLLDWYQTANRLDSENKALRELLKMKSEEAVTYQSAKVISDAATKYSHTILVRKGANQGLAKGQGVLSQEGLLGRVIETTEKTARVLLMSDVNSRIPVAIEGTQDRAILAGTNNGDPILAHLPETNQIQIGKKVVTSGHGGVFPFGVPVGEVYKNDKGQLSVRPYADPNRANYVQIVDYGIPAGSTSRATASSPSSSVFQ